MSVNSVPAEVLSTSGFKRAFLQCVGRNPTGVAIISPYIGKLPAYRDIVNFCRSVLRHGDAMVQVVTRPPGHGEDRITETQADVLVRLGVDLWFRRKPWLHAKVYQFEFREGDRAAFVGSANFTLGGFERNDETVALLRGHVDNERVKAEIARLAGRGSVTYPAWRAYGQQVLRRGGQNG